MNGVSYVAPINEVTAATMTPIVELNANFLAIIPYGYLRPSNPKVHFNTDRQHWGETKDGVEKTIEYAAANGLQVMIKPHIWVIGQGWAGDFDLEDESDWKLWEEGYRDYILTFAAVAEANNVKLYCIGTEFRKAVVKREQFWRKLISEVREVYSGQITYAANWDNYENVKFWNELDFIGIDAYFPISDQKTPTIEVLNKNWVSIKDKLAGFSSKQKKQIIFTEFGYQSRDFAADGHWKHEGEELSINLTAQAAAYEAIFQSFWKEEWYAGGFLWKWHSDHTNIGGINCDEYTPQNKPSENTIKEYFSR